MKSYNFVGQIQKKEVEPKVFALLFESKAGDSLIIKMAYSLEEALEKSGEKVLPTMWETLTLDQMKEQIMIYDLTEVKKSGKNALIQELIASGAIETLEAKKHLLSKSEYEYVKNVLGKV